MNRERIYDSFGSKSKGENFCVTFVFCIDYIEKMDNKCPKELFPFVFLVP